MFASFPVARAFGITFRVDWTWIALTLLTAVFWDGDPKVGLANFMLVSVMVFMHEVGHSWMGRALKLDVRDITLSFFGGYTRMGWGNRHEDSKAEMLVAVAGPAVNLVLAAVFGLFVDELAWGRTLAFGDLAQKFYFLNLALGLSNLLPFFPADGGRVLRSSLGLFLDWLTATRIAALIGRLAAVGMIVVGFVYTLWAFVLFGFLMWRACGAEVFLVRLRRAQAAKLHAFEGLRARPATFTPVDTPPAPTADAPPTDSSGARKPVDNPLASSEGELDDEALKRLEQFRGRLRGPVDREE